MKRYAFVRIQGGLGNQMFQYAGAVGFAAKHGLEVVLDTSWYRYSRAKDRPFELDRFRLPASRDIGRTLSGSATWIAAKAAPRSPLLGRVTGLLLGADLLREPDASQIVPEFFSATPGRNVLLEGYWQSEDYFSDVHKTIRERYRLKDSPTPRYETYRLQIEERPSASLHVRRGDYLQDRPDAVLGEDYYRRAVAAIESERAMVRFFVFSDDPEWAKANMRWIGNAVFVENDPRAHSTEDMMLMAACQDNIVANSSYSWWAAWLNSNPNKKVMAPARWGDSKRQFEHIVPGSWIKI